MHSINQSISRDLIKNQLMRTYLCGAWPLLLMTMPTFLRVVDGWWGWWFRTSSNSDCNVENFLKASAIFSVK